MIIVISVILFFILFLLSNDKNKKIVYGFSIFLFSIILLGTNGRFEKLDYSYYLNLYLGHVYSGYGDLDIKGGYDLEKPYAYFCYIVRFLLPRMPYSYILCYGLMWIIPISLILKKGSKSVPLSLLFICTILNCSQLLFIITAQRQMIANVAILWAFYILTYTTVKAKWKKVFVSTLIVLALFSHSSSYFVIPIIILLYFIKLPEKKYVLFLIILSFLISPYLQSLLQPLFYGFMITLGSGEEIARSTYYYINDVYETGSVSMSYLLPFTMVGFFLIYFSSKEEYSKFGTRLVAFSTITYNLFNSIPLLNRSLMIFIIMGMILCIPNAVNYKKKAKYIMSIIGIMLIVTTINVYIKVHNPIFPYPYIWEEPYPFTLYKI